jgi:hypothetical protein
VTAPSLLASGGFANAFSSTQASLSYMSPLGMSQIVNSNAGRPTNQTYFNKAGTISKLYVNVVANTANVSSNLTVYINGSATLIAVTIPANSGAATYTDLTDSVSVSVGDNGCYQLDTGAIASGSLTIGCASVNFTASSGTSQILAGNNVTGLSATGTRYHPLAGQPVNTGVEGLQQIQSTIAGTASGIFVLITASNAAVTFRFRKNGSAGNQVFSVPSSSTGLFSDPTNTDTVAVGDLINLHSVVTAGSTPTTISTGCTFEATNDGESQLHQHDNSGTITTTATFVSLLGKYTRNTEGNAQSVMGVAGTIDLLFLAVASPNNSTSTTTVRLRKNGANGSQTFTIPASTSGTFQDVTNPGDTVAAGDLVCINVTGHNATLNINGTGARLTTAGSGNVYNVSCDEVLSAADFMDTIAALVANSNETLNALETTSSKGTLVAATTEIGNAADTTSSKGTLVGATTENLNASETTSSKGILPASVAENLTVADTTNTGSPSYSVATAETLTVADTTSSQASLGAAQVENLNALDTESTQANIPVTVAENLSAADSQSNQLNIQVAITENGNLVDTPSATAPGYQVSVSENLSALDTPSSQAVMAAATSETLAVLDGTTIALYIQVAVSEALSALDIPSTGAGAYSVSVAELAAANDIVTSQAIFNVVCAELAALTDIVVAQNPNAPGTDYKLKAPARTWDLVAPVRSWDLVAPARDWDLISPARN